MREIDLHVPDEWDDASVLAMVEEAAAADCLSYTVGTLRTCPGCTHWHFKRPGNKGTLEGTWWPKTRRLWLKVHPMREAPWIDGSISAFKKAFPQT